ncbi:MAG: DUF1002 domain-containing protein [Lachnospiraceae bacterium]|nr:DUF1002 domain-containing protein [Lachnospiraceae bacterium]
MKKKVYKLLAVLLSVTLFLSVTALPVLADDVTEITWGEEESTSGEESTAQVKPYLALGKDLSPEQLATVLSLMGLAGTDLSSYNVVYVTNDEEHQYLDSYIDPKVIGTKSLSSVLVRPAESGHGINVDTRNITYCTVGMYQNALLTAGVENADILVVAPTPLSGTAALIGALKAYAQMTDSTVNTQALDTSLDELVTTGELKEELENVSPEEVEELFAFVKAKVTDEKLESREDIEEAVLEAVEEYKSDIKLNDEEIQKIIDVMVKIKDLGLDYGTLLDETYKLYKDGDLNPDSVKDFAKESGKKLVGAMIKSFFTGVAEKIKGFFSGLFDR